MHECVTACTHIATYVRMHVSLHACMCHCMHVSMHAHTCLYHCMYTRACVNACTHMLVSLHVHACMCQCMHTHACIIIIIATCTARKTSAHETMEFPSSSQARKSTKFPQVQAIVERGSSQAWILPWKLGSYSGFGTSGKLHSLQTEKLLYTEDFLTVLFKGQVEPVPS